MRFDFDVPVVLTAIDVMPGYSKYADGWDRWWSNGRLHRVQLTFSDGLTQTVSFADKEGWRSIQLPQIRTRWVRMTIVRAYPAEPGPHAATDTSVSEVKFTGYAE